VPPSVIQDFQESLAVDLQGGVQRAALWIKLLTVGYQVFKLVTKPHRAQGDSGEPEQLNQVLSASAAVGGPPRQQCHDPLGKPMPRGDAASGVLREHCHRQSPG